MADRGFIAYPPIERHALFGDRRVAALVAADGTLDWLCLPRYDGEPVFGALLDANSGGFWRLGPAEKALGAQTYWRDSMVVETRWRTSSGELELVDSMAWPADSRPEDRARARVVLRRLRCAHGEVVCRLDFQPRHGFGPPISLDHQGPGRVGFRIGDATATLWCSRELEVDTRRRAEGVHARFTLRAGEAVWAVLAYDDPSGREWTPDRVDAEIQQTDAYWQSRAKRLTVHGPRAAALRRAGLLVQQLTYAPSGSVVAAPTTSLPARIGGPRNWDYRYSWVRDTSLSLDVLSRLGDIGEAQRYLDWLSGLGSSVDAPLQVVYRVDGTPNLPEDDRCDIAGYRESQPVRIGNRAGNQWQLGSFGFLTDCTWTYLQHGGQWHPEYWELIRRSADCTAEHWHKPDCGVWELDAARYTSSRVMAWVALDRATRIAERVGQAAHAERWQPAIAAIRDAVLTHGWSEQLNAFRQRLEGHNLDAAALLIPIQGFLPPDEPRVQATVHRLLEDLAIDGWLCRFHADRTPGGDDVPLGEYEGAFLACTFWLAQCYAKGHRPDLAEPILARAEHLANGLGAFAEDIDPRSGAYLGNYPLLLSQVTYAHTALDVAG